MKDKNFFTPRRKRICKRRPFRRQKVTYCEAKGGLLQAKRPHMAEVLTIKHLQRRHETRRRGFEYMRLRGA